RVESGDARELVELVGSEVDRLAGLVERLLHPAPPRPFAPTNIHAVLARLRQLAETEAGRSVKLNRAFDPSLPEIRGAADRLVPPAPPRRFAATNIHAVLERVRQLAEPEAGWSVKLNRDFDPSLPEIRGDADRLVQAVWNLVRNALESGASTVSLRTRAEHHIVIGENVHRLAVRVEVADDGRGVPDDLAERIFLPLVTGRAEGTGLGLPLAQQIAREHGGSLGYRSR